MCLAIPAQIKELSDEGHLAWVDILGVRRKVNVDLLREEPAQPGDWVLVHVGFAMNKISEQRANEQLQLLAQLGEAEQVRREIEGVNVSSERPTSETSS